MIKRTYPVDYEDNVYYSDYKSQVRSALELQGVSIDLNDMTVDELKDMLEVLEEDVREA